MSLSKLNNPPSIDDIEDTDDGDQDIALAPEPQPTERPGEALGRIMLEAAVTPKKLKKLLETSPSLIVIKTQDEASARLLDTYLTGTDRALAVQAYTELPRSGGRQEPQGREELRKLEYGRSVILISQDPETMLVPEAMASADVLFAVPAPDLKTVRKTIRAVTGMQVRGLLPSDIENLGIRDFLAAIRPGLGARDCVNNLRRAASKRAKGPSTMSHVPALEHLAMTKAASDWAFGTLRLMEQVAAGGMESSALRFGCFEGPPGTGKTTVAAALAKSAGWTFVSTSVGKWFAESGGHLGDVIRAARRFFDEIAQSKGPVVGLLDEIDGLPNRAVMEPKDAQWWTPVVTFVLTEIDRLRQSKKPVLLLAATNHFDRLDMALIRPGRIETKVQVLLPDFEDRQRLFHGFVGKNLSANAVATLARLAVLATPAQIESWCRSALATAEAQSRKLALGDLLALVAPQDGRSAETDRAIAVHEAGHALVAHDLGLPVAEISILNMGTIGGFVQTSRTDQDVLTRAEVERLGAMILGGRAADIVLGAGAHAGAAADIEAVNTLLRSAMLDFGLYGSLKTAKNTDSRNFRDGVPLATAIEAELSRMLDRASEIVRRRKADIFALVAVLISERVVTGERFADILDHGQSQGSGHGNNTSGRDGNDKAAVMGNTQPDDGSDTQPERSA